MELIYLKNSMIYIYIYNCKNDFHGIMKELTRSFYHRTSGIDEAL